MMRNRLSELAAQLGGCDNPVCESAVCVLARTLMHADAMTFFGDIARFHERFALEYRGKPRLLDSELAEFRIKFLQEELDEYKKATEEATKYLRQSSLPFDTSEEDDAWPDLACYLEKQLDALVDLVYVAIGTAYLHGYDFNEAWRRVHNANMKKIRAHKVDESKRGSTYDVVKPVGWEAPNHYDLVKNHAHKEKP